MKGNQQLFPTTISNSHLARRHTFSSSQVLVLICQTQEIDSRKLITSLCKNHSSITAFSRITNDLLVPKPNCGHWLIPTPHLLPWHCEPSTPPPQALSGTFENQELKKQVPTIYSVNCKPWIYVFQFENLKCFINLETTNVAGAHFPFAPIQGVQHTLRYRHDLGLKSKFARLF